MKYVFEVAEAEVDPLASQQDLPAPHVGEDTDQLDCHRGQEPGQEDAPGEATDLRPQLRHLRGHELEALDAEVGLGRRLGERHLNERAPRRTSVHRGEPALAAVPERLEAADAAILQLDEHGALHRRQAHLLDRHRQARGRGRRASQPPPQPAEQAREGRVRGGERPGLAQVGGPDGAIPAPELEEDADEDRERDAELGERSESSLHVADRPCGAPYIAQPHPAAKPPAGSLEAIRDP